MWAAFRGIARVAGTEPPEAPQLTPYCASEDAEAQRVTQPYGSKRGGPRFWT